MTAPSSPMTSVDQCVVSLRSSILDGSIAPGTRLPPERKLAENFGVNRVTVRSALARLAESGLLSVRQGSGYLVRDYRLHGGPDLLTGIADLAAEAGSLPEVVADLLLVRRQLAAAVLERLCSTCTAEDRARTTEAVDSFAALVSAGADPAELAQADVHILGTLLLGTRSAVLGLSLNPISGVLASLPELRDALYQHPEENLAGWQVLLAWLQQPTTQAIDAIMSELRLRDERTVAEIDATVRWDRLGRT